MTKHHPLLCSKFIYIITAIFFIMFPLTYSIPMFLDGEKYQFFLSETFIIIGYAGTFGLIGIFYILLLENKWHWYYLTPLFGTHYLTLISAIIIIIIRKHLSDPFIIYTLLLFTFDFIIFWINIYLLYHHWKNTRHPNIIYTTPHKYLYTEI